ncbi:uncharacterized protein LOC110055207 isoform X4 [Orbicella faveolata]|uniref:uncharacterized protein LOC110055207 isoform X4 n=1 Tax=Orbicella faveolata TaxID=48498 RepID=UPI0009E5EE37|nr:uncharacterized protein LOC110055207 isoform X4 [Orbicella faveolata]
MNLGCHFSGWPLPHEVHWYKDGELITNGTEGISKKIPTVTSSEIAANISSNVTLSCRIDYDDYCPQELLWKFNDKPEPLPESGKKYNVELKDTNTKCQKEFILSIFDVTESDNGTYSCHWLCDYENATRAAIDLKVVDDLQTGVRGRF